MYVMPKVTIEEPERVLINVWPALSCNRNESFAVFVVHSSAEYRERRSLIRESWASFDKLHQYNIRVVFILGTPEQESVQKEVQKEAALWNDIVQGSFNESYRNLTYKHILALKWVIQLKQCLDVKVVVKLDDDVFINMYQLDVFLKSVYSNDSKAGQYMYCNICSRYYPHRNQASKYVISEHDAPYWQWPAFCQGFAYIISPDVPDLLYKAMPFTKSVWLDDVYVTGYLAREARIQQIQMQPPFATFVNKYSESSGIFFRSEDMKKALSFWREMADYHHIRLSSQG